jgi:hypothetical protein
MIVFVHNDGGRAAAGFNRLAVHGDCVARSVAIASGRPYAEVHAALAAGNAAERITKRTGRHAGKRSADHGIHVKRKWFKTYMASLGFTWVPTMEIGGGCKVHLRADELPTGRLVVQVSKHMCAVVDGVVHDTHDPSRDGTRAVYGYWVFEP